MRDITEIIIHCTATPAGRYVNTKAVNRWHCLRGWKGIGYHYLILLDGTIEVGRHESMVGAHTQGHNSRSIAVCYVGGLHGVDTRTDQQRVALYRLVKDLKARYPKAVVIGHNELSNKQCPSFSVQNWLKEIKI